MGRDNSLRVWIDMANSPHVLFFKPVIAELESRGHEVLITARDFAQTVPLLEQSGLAFRVVGHHGGKNLIAKSSAILTRATALASFARANKVDLSVHHNSYAQAVASFVDRIPTVALMDYEHQPANHLSFRLADKVMMPAVIPDQALAKYRMFHKLVRYSGLKEDVYLPGLAEAHDPSALQSLDIPAESPVVVFRPAPDMAAYHRFENPLCDELLDYIAEQPGVFTIVIPRTPDQASRLVFRGSDRLRVLDSPVDGAALLMRADLVITAGGTMGREAAVLGVPAYTMFAGRRAAIDEHLEAEGRMVQISTREDFALIRFDPKVPQVLNVAASRILVEHITDEILKTRVPRRQ